MKIITITILAAVLSGCAGYVNKDVDSRLGYRKLPTVYIERLDYLPLQVKCSKVTGVPGFFYGGCARVPIDPSVTCNVYVLKGDETKLNHELMHCHGYGDVILPWKAQKVTKQILIVGKEVEE